jgi:XTP/dITP diphosphohydrolase
VRVIRASLVSKNAHKARELAVLLPGWEIVPTLATELPDEVGETFYENARAKARFGRTVDPPDRWTIGEDSGLEVEGLGGRPGIYSARYAGPGASDEENVAVLLAELAGVTGAGRRGRYVSELVCLTPGLDELRGTGTLEGTIAASPRGSQGFGYDPVFVPDGEERTVAELGNEWKARRSHRATAARKLREAVGKAARGR